jgi:prevent-host-death family protein
MKSDPSSKRKAGRRRREQSSGMRHPERSGRRQGHSYTATEAKNQFGRLLDEALQGATVVITKHAAPKAVLISMDRFDALQQTPGLKLDTLRSEFDALLMRMQGHEARTGMERAFSASAEQLGKAAGDAARRG